MSRTFAYAHRRYAGYINARMRVTGHLWQGQFGSVAMDEEHLFHAIRYVSMDPVRAGLVDRAEAWRWSSVTSHLSRQDNELVKVVPVLDRYGDFATFLAQEDVIEVFKRLRQSETTGRPLGSEDWIDKLTAMTGRKLKAKKRGPKRKKKGWD